MRIQVHRWPLVRARLETAWEAQGILIMLVTGAMVVIMGLVTLLVYMVVGSTTTLALTIVASVFLLEVLAEAALRVSLELRRRADERR